MQNADTTAITTTTTTAVVAATNDEDKWDSSRGPATLDTAEKAGVEEAEATESVASPCAADTPEVQSEPEPVVKAKKSRSRFTSALRKLSKTRKRDKVAPKEVAAAPASEALTSGAEDASEETPPEVKPKTKNKLTKRLLGSLRSKSKGSPKSSADKEEHESPSAAVKEADQKPRSTGDTHATGLGSSAKVPKKVELPAPASADSKSAANAGENDYLTPEEEPLPPPSVDSSSAASKKKLKAKKSGTQSGATTTSTTVTTTSTAALQAVPTVTQSARDTPPRERAPAKPTRPASSSSAVSSTPTSTAAVRKPTTRAAATLTTATITQRSRWSSLKRTTASAQRQPTPPQSNSKQQKGSAAEFMQNPPGTPQRGHRFPKPSATTATANGGSNTTPSVVVVTPSKTTPIPTESSEQKLQASETLVLPAASSNSQQQQSNDQLLQPPTYPPPPIPLSVSPFATPETRSPAHRYSSISSAEAAADDLQNSLQSNVDDSVADAYSSGADDAISSAESAQPGEDYPLISQDIRHGRTPTIRFAIGSVVRAASTSIETLLEQHSIDSADSLSPTSEANRRRIRYVVQPTAYNSVDPLRVASYDSDCEDNPMPAFGDLTMDEEMEPTILTTTSNEKREHLYKILVIGELGTGKTSFIKRYVHQFFSQNYRATIGVDFALKVLHWDANTIVRLQLWDIAGQERFGNMTRVYYKEAVGAFIVFDVTRSGTFDCVSKWKEDLDSKVQLPDGSPIPCILLANKCDQEKQGLVTTPEKMDEYVRENGFAGWFETSAKENVNIDEAARALVSKILLNDKLISAADLADSEKFNLKNSGDDTMTETKSKCSC